MEQHRKLRAYPRTKLLVSSDQKNLNNRAVWGRAVNRPHWSYSQLSQYLRCPLQYYFERIQKLPRPFLPSGMAFGSAIHQSLAEYHRELQLGQNMTVAQVQATFLLRLFDFD